MVFFGICRPYKGLDVLLRALARAPRHVVLTVAGEFWGKAEAETRALIGELELAGRVTLRPGYVPADQIPGLFAQADALVLPYRSATSSQNAWLAFEYGVPVVVTRAGTLADAVRDGVHGVVCEPGTRTICSARWCGSARRGSQTGCGRRCGRRIRAATGMPTWRPC